MYGPAFRHADLHAQYDFGDHIGTLYTNIRSIGAVTYHFIFSVERKPSGPISLYVTSEQNRLYGMFGDTASDGSHFLCSFEGGMHHNFGCSNDWSDLDKFEIRALTMAGEYLKVPGASVRRIESSSERNPMSRLDS